MPSFGDKSHVPYLVFGKQARSESADPNIEDKIQYKKVVSWRDRKAQKPEQGEFYVDVTSQINQDKNFVEDVLLHMLKLINEDQSLRLEDLPTKFTKRKPDNETEKE